MMMPTELTSCIGIKFLVYLEGTLSSGISPQQRARHFEKWNALSCSSGHFSWYLPSEYQLKKRRGVSHCGLCHLHLKSIWRQMKNYGNSNISPCKNISSKKKSSKRYQNPSRYYYNSIITNLKFQHKPKYHLSKILE
jgi:hypothetical protein